MSLFYLFSLLVVLAALFSYINYLVIKLPQVIGIMLVAIVFSLGLLGLANLYPDITSNAKHLLAQFDFSKLLLQVMLSFLLFAGAIQIKISDLRKELVPVLLYSTFSVLLSTFLVGLVSYHLLLAFNIPITLIQAMMFGALISPTDPIAVLAILKKAGVSKSLETTISGESLFNDGVAVVIYMTLWEISTSTEPMTGSQITKLFTQEALGGIALGLAIGYLSYRMIKSIDNYQVEILITLAVVMGGYSLAHVLHVSGPLAMVIAGLITGNPSKERGMSLITEKYIDMFWEIIDEILNAILFVLIGLEVLIIPINIGVIIAGILLLFVTLIVRYISLGIPTLLLQKKYPTSNRTLFLLTWGGLRGGISIALALALVPQLGRDLWVPITYIIVCFSIIVQGTTISLVRED